MSSKKISPFFLNRAVEQFASKPSTPISLKHLINFGKARGSGEEEKLLKGGNFVRCQNGRFVADGPAAHRAAHAALAPSA